MVNLSGSNWLMLQGTEPSSNSLTPHLWSFIQMNYKFDKGRHFVNSKGQNVTPFNELTKTDKAIRGG